MKLAIFGKAFDPQHRDTLEGLFAVMGEKGINWCVEKAYWNLINEAFGIENAEVFAGSDGLLASGADFVISLGGDGTLLETLGYVRDKGIPVLGINLGRLGFLSLVSKNEVGQALNSLQNGHFSLDRRTVLELSSTSGMFGDYNYALNDFTIHKRDTGSMITIEAFLNGDYFNAYWADGIIVSTPTGSTAYSLSCGGPVIFPESNNFAITPVAPHNLTIRPVIVPDSTIISFKVKGRGANCLVSLDARYQIMEEISELAIQKADFAFNLVRLSNQGFTNTLREKLKWGFDSRNV